jgi:phage terminase small subunit
MATTKSNKLEKRDADGLTDQQRQFAYFYVTEARMNGIEAARMAGFKGNADVLYYTVQRLLSNPAIKTKIAEHLGQMSMTSTEVLAELTKIAKMPVEEFTDPRVVKNKLTALAMLAKHHGLLIERHDHTTAGAALTFADLAKLATGK